MRSAYSVIVWGPGVLGGILVREVIRKPELRLAGVLAYSADKDGRDAGELAGTEAVGVLATTDKERIFDTPADCVLYTPNVRATTEVDSEATNEICRLLESGRNVITSIGYWFPERHGPELVDRLQNACRVGGSSLHGTGVNPGLLNERLVVTLTGVCTVVHSIHVREMCDTSFIESAEMMRAIGYGSKPEDGSPLMELVGDRGYGESVALACHLLNVPIDKVTSEKKYVLAERDYELKAINVPAGTIAGLHYSYTATIDDKPFFTLEEIWYVDPELAPPGATSSDSYEITIEGEPTSLHAAIDLKASVRDDKRFRDGDRVLPAYYATAVPMIQTIPVVVEASSGIVYPHAFAHFMPDLRQFSGATTSAAV